MERIVIKNTDSNDDIAKNIDEKVDKISKRISKRPHKRQRSPDQSEIRVQRDKEPRNSKKDNRTIIENLKLQLDELMEEKDLYCEKLQFMGDQMLVLKKLIAKGASAHVKKLIINENVRTLLENGTKVVRFGPNNTAVQHQLFKTINWKSVSSATRSLLEYVFDSHTLATHSMTGRCSNAYKKRKVKSKLDPKKLQDIIHLVCENCSVEAKVVRNCITTKCADENKSLQRRIKQRQSQYDLNEYTEFEESDRDS